VTCWPAGQRLRSCFACKTTFADPISVTPARDRQQPVGFEKVDVMKRFFSVSITAMALLTPIASPAQTTLVYRPELHGMVAQKVEAPAPRKARTDRDEAARHEAMARSYRAQTSHRNMEDMARHCDRLAAELKARAAVAASVSE
jgi:hypothetical protein